MRVLLDTHAFVWWATGDQALTQTAQDAIKAAFPDIFVSAASVWEITTKYRLGKWPGVSGIAADVEFAILDNGFQSLSIAMAHAQQAGTLAGAHGDPFDRMLAAQSLLEGLTLISKDSSFDSFGVRRVW